MPHHLRVANSLIRVEGLGLSSALRSPFERPRADLDLWVLELGFSKDPSVQQWCDMVARVIGRRARTFAKLRGHRAHLSLYVETAGSLERLRLEASFLALLASSGMALEHRHTIGDA